MRRIELEMILSVNVKDFETSKIEFEQYLTPARTVANLIHRAHQLGDIKSKNVLDMCAGTGILGIGATIMGASVTSVELDEDAIKILKENYETLDLDPKIVLGDIFAFNSEIKYDTVLINPPFGIQQRKRKDMDFIIQAHKFGEVVYSIHDGSKSNQEMISKLYKRKGFEITELYLDDFPLKKRYAWHKKSITRYQVLVVRSVKKKS